MLFFSWSHKFSTKRNDSSCLNFNNKYLNLFSAFDYINTFYNSTHEFDYKYIIFNFTRNEITRHI